MKVWGLHYVLSSVVFQRKDRLSNRDKQQNNKSNLKMNKNRNHTYFFGIKLIVTCNVWQKVKQDTPMLPSGGIVY